MDDCQAISKELADLVQQLRRIPMLRSVPLEIAVQLQDCIARLETLAGQSPIDPLEARRVAAISAALLKSAIHTLPPR